MSFPVSRYDDLICVGFPVVTLNAVVPYLPSRFRLPIARIFNSSTDNYGWRTIDTAGCPTITFNNVSNHISGSIRIR